MKKINLVILPLLSITALASCNKDIKEYEVISRDNVKYLLYNGVDKIAAVVGYNYGLADEITLPSNVNGYPLMAISRDAFEYSNLTKITIPDSIVYIGSGAFSECGYLKDIKLSNSIDTLYSNTFENCTSLTDITLPNNISLIEDEVFLGCYSLTNITMPTSLFGLGSYAFGGCESLEKVDFSNTRLNDIGSYCFYDCDKLSDISLSSNITVILENAFSNCSSLEKIYIPDSILYLGEDIFDNCSDNLKILFKGSELPPYYSYTFSSGYPFALGTDESTNLNDVFPKNTYFQYSINDIKTSSPSAFLHYELTDESEITVPSEIGYGSEGKTAPVTGIMPNAFSSKESLTSIDLSNLSKLTYIGADAFYYDTELKTVTLPKDKTSTYLDIGAFYKCRKLTKVENLNQINDLELHGYTFAECYGLGNDAGTPFIFPSNIKSITSTDFKEWGTPWDQYIKLEKDSYEEIEGGTILLKAKGDKNGGLIENIKLTKASSSPEQYSNTKYFGKAIITLEE